MGFVLDNLKFLSETVYNNLRGLTIGDYIDAGNATFAAGGSAFFGGKGTIIGPTPTGKPAFSLGNLKDSFLFAASVGVGGGAGALAKVGSMGVPLKGVASLVMKTRGLLSARLLVTMGVVTNIPAIFGFGIRTTQYIYNFNWNITDKELDQQLQSKLDVLYGMLGGVAGSTLGYLVCGALPGVASFAFNPAAARVILGGKGADGKFEAGTLTEEASEEVRAQLASITNSAFQALVNAQIARSFQGMRRWLKRPGTPFHEILKKALGKDFEKWGSAGQPAWSFAQAVENRVEKISDARLRNFTEEFLENFSDSCIESGYIVADGIGTAMAAQKLMQQQLLGAQQTVEITFDRSSS